MLCSLTTAVIYLQALEGSLAPSNLVLHHSANSTPNHASRRAEMKRTLGRVGIHLLAQVRHKEELVADKGTRDVDLLAADKNYILTAQQLLGYNRGESTKQVTAAVNDDRSRQHL